MEKACHRGGKLPMATDDPIRASDADREVVVATLRDAFEVGRLTLEEFNERVSAAFASRSWGDLRKLTIDLPSQPNLGSDVPGRHLPPAAGLPSFPPRPGLAREPDAGQEQPPALRRRRPVAVLVPLAVWTLLVLHNAGGAGVAFLLIVVFVVITILSSIGRR
jgi:Domain of unknown function (DUF1707)